MVLRRAYYIYYLNIYVYTRDTLRTQSFGHDGKGRGYATITTTTTTTTDVHVLTSLSGYVYTWLDKLHVCAVTWRGRYASELTQPFFREVHCRCIIILYTYYVPSIRQSKQPPATTKEKHIVYVIYVVLLLIRYKCWYFVIKHLFFLLRRLKWKRIEVFMILFQCRIHRTRKL